MSPTAAPDRSGTTLAALARSCHPLPTVAVTALSGGLGLLAGLSWSRVLLLVAAVLAGQLSIGWSNDALDARRDAEVGRSHKPVATGEITGRTVWLAAVSALLVCAVLSVLLGWAAAAVSLLIVACGWAYNLGLKGTVFSFVPYAIAFGSLPALATLAGRPPQLPAPWAMLAGALLGVGAHFANVLPDLAGDVATGVRGLPHRLGARASALLAPLLVFGASAAIVLAPGAPADSRTLPWWVLVPLGLLAIGAGILGLRRPTSRAVFVGVVLIAGVDVLLFAVSGGSLR